MLQLVFGQLKEHEWLTFKCFEHFTQQKFVVCEDQNFGADFAIYDEFPDKKNIHAKYLVFTNPDLRAILLSRATQILKKEVTFFFSLFLALF
jgi:tRNA splicing endonuclease